MAAAMAAGSFQDTVPLEKRTLESQRIMSKYPDRVPVICEKAARSDLPEIEKKKFLVPETMLCGEFKYIIHKHVTSAAPPTGTETKTIYLFANNKSIKTAATLKELFETHKHEDGFLYLTYSSENTLGAR